MGRKKHRRSEKPPEGAPRITPPHGFPPLAPRRRWRVVLGALGLAAVLAFLGLDNHKFWDDEANTAIFARNYLEHGALLAWDGTNLVGFNIGGELDENLINTYMPPLQYYVTAGSFSLFGAGTFTARLPFVLAGLATLLALTVLCRNLWGEEGPWHVPAALLALSPAFLLFIRNARYFSLGALLSVGLLAALTAPLDTRRRMATALGIALPCTAGLWLANYFNAAGTLVLLAPLLALPRFRDRRRLILAGAVVLVTAAMVVHILVSANPFQGDVRLEEELSAVPRFFTLLAWYLRDLGLFEFFPLLLAPCLALPLIMPRLEGARPLARHGALLLVAMALTVLVTVIFSPQPVARSTQADMRYVVPLIPLGAAVSALALALLWRAWRPAAAVAALLVVFSNIPHLAFLDGPRGMLPPRGPRCTLCDYVVENIRDYDTSTEIVIDELASLEDGSVVFIFPTYMTYSPMFYLPNLKFCCQLREENELLPEWERELPDYLWFERAYHDLDLAIINRAPPPMKEGPLHIGADERDKKYYFLGMFRVERHLDVLREDRSRPEIPWHTFDPAELEAVDLNPGLTVVSLRPPPPGWTPPAK